MIVPMKKVSLFVLHRHREEALLQLRRLGLLHLEQTPVTSPALAMLAEQMATLEAAMATLADRAARAVEEKQATREECLALAARIAGLSEEQRQLQGQLARDRAELARLQAWGEVDPEALQALADKGVHVTLHELSPGEYRRYQKAATTLPLHRSRAFVRFLQVQLGEAAAPPEIPTFPLPALSTAALRARMAETEAGLQQAELALCELAGYLGSLKDTLVALQKEAELQAHSASMEQASLSAHGDSTMDIAYFTGYLPAEGLGQLQSLAKEMHWGLLASDPEPEDEKVPTKLHNNRFVSLIYPLTDFLGTVPGYFEYDISAWFLGFILVFFGIIFGDGGYGLLICAIAGALCLRAHRKQKPLPAALLLILLMGGATVLWGILTCTWFGLPAEVLPIWLQRISLPVISNVYADALWVPFWTEGGAGLTTSQNLQILCFALALVQLSAAHLMGLWRHRRSLRLLGDLGSVMQLLGIFYVVLSLVVNGAVFGLGLVIGGVPVGGVAIALVGVGFLLSFVFSNYEGSIAQSVLSSLKGIVSCLLGVVNVFSDIVSYIRLWAVGLAGAAISATVNELAGPFFGNLLLVAVAIVLLVFGHGLNMILNVLSVIVHGVRLNTLEFSSHLDMSWSGRKYKPFEE